MEHTQFVEIYRQFEKALATEQRSEGVLLARQIVEQKLLTLGELYQDVLTPLLNKFDYGTDDTRIIREHIRSSLIRSIVESLYPFVMANALPKNGESVLITLPDGEYHEIGARMALDFFEMNGFKAIYTGSNTPAKDILAAIAYQKPTYLAISISNFFNLIKSEQLIKAVQSTYPAIKILVGGAAFVDPAHRAIVPHTLFLSRLEDIATLRSEVNHVIA